MLRFGIISEADHNKGLVRVKFAEDDVVSGWLPVIQKSTLKNKSYHTYDVNEHVCCLMDENAEHGAVLGAVYSKNETPGSVKGGDVQGVQFEDGTKVSYNRSTHELKIECTGDVKVICKNATIDADTAVEITAPQVNIDGQLNVTKDIKSDMNVFAGPMNIGLSTHKHTGVQSGPATTATPIP